MEILRQLADLCLQAVPTVIIVFLFYLFLRANFFRPLERAMAERTKRIDGAKAEAAAAQASAKDEIERYNEAMKKARGEIYLEQEAARQDALDERAKLLKALRTRNQEAIQAAKKRIAAEVASARKEIELQTPAFADQITRKILERSGPSAGGRR
jgi:F0F1-type ATP synthase membrane subunit b/b'